MRTELQPCSWCLQHDAVVQRRMTCLSARPKRQTKLTAALENPRAHLQNVFTGQGNTGVETLYV